MSTYTVPIGKKKIEQKQKTCTFDIKKKKDKQTKPMCTMMCKGG